MTFHWPHIFWLLVIPAILAVWEILHRRAQASSQLPKILRARAGAHSLTLQPANAPLRLLRLRWRLWLGLVLAITALARPQWGRLEEPVFDQSREILIAVDLSRSMLAQDVKPSRLDRAKLLITSLLERLDGERVGLMVFAGTAFLQSPLSADYEILREFLPELGPDFLPQGGSNYDALLQTSLTAFTSAKSADRFLIILSDGESTDDTWRKRIPELKEKGVRIIGLGIGTAQGSMIPATGGGFIKDERGAVVLSKLNNTTLRELSSQTGGTYTDASTWVDIPQLIKTTVERGTRGDFRDTSKVRLAERFQWPLAPALLLLLLSLWREFPVHPRNRDLRLGSGKRAPGQPPAVEAATGSAPPPLPPAPPPPRATAGVAALALLLALALGSAAPHLVAQPAPKAAPAPAATAPANPDAPQVDPYAEPVIKLLGQLAGRTDLQADDYANIAIATSTYGQRHQLTKQPILEGPIVDALAAVDAGQALDPKKLDWEALRENLRALLEHARNPEKQDNQDQQQNDQDKQEDGEGGEGGEGNKQGDPKPQEQDPNNPQPKPKPEDEASRQNTSPDANQQEERKSEAPKEAQKAFGDMKDQPKPPPPSPGDMQQVGGGEKNAPPPNTPVDPNMVVPLQKLEQLKAQDSPARLFQLMQEQPPTSAPAQKGKDW